MTTTDLSKFGYREIRMAKELLVAWVDGNGLPQDFWNDGVTIMMNQYSGNVFLTNSEYEVAMIGDNNQLESFYSSPYEGKEGFFNELLEEYKDMHPEDQEWFRDIAKNLRREDEIPQEQNEQERTNKE